MKIGQYFTTDRIVCTDGGYTCAPVLLSGGVALVNMEKVEKITSKMGAPALYRYTFQFLRPGKAEIQFATYRVFEYKDVVYEDVLTFMVEPTDAIFTGSWDAFHDLTEEDQKIFNEVMEPRFGVLFTPKKVSVQIVAGRNLRFVCTGKESTKEAREFQAIVNIFVPLPGHGDPQLVNIERVLL